ncbi:hypothetical protein [Streptomyces sp. NBRC 109706]|uniref:hypothetical protein n=1 Tax=Streptomyces sp. NBRC 109706 TaxID=1550035 RepID=UPI000781550F|nr:hypothetical protein [Streptomyces sp. NBRC 109706]
MTDPRWARETDNGRYYEDPQGGPDLVSVTNVLSTGVAKHAITPWAVKVTAEYCVNNRLTVARRALRDRAELLKDIKKVHRDARESAADLGTRIHHRAHMMALGAPYPPDPEVDPYARQLARWWESWGVDLDRHIEAAEMTFLHRALGYAGTGDCLIWLPTGPGWSLELWLIDYKTSAKRPAKQVFPEQAMQLAALRYAETVLLPDDSEMAVPAVARTGILNLRRRSRALVPMPGDRRAWRAFRGALETTKWMHASAGNTYEALTPPPAESRELVDAGAGRAA